eukprot:287260-Amphidinium_carterae.1
MKKWNQLAMQRSTSCSPTTRRPEQPSATRSQSSRLWAWPSSASLNPEFTEPGRGVIVLDAPHRLSDRRQQPRPVRLCMQSRYARGWQRPRESHAQSDSPYALGEQPMPVCDNGVRAR